MTYNAQHFEKMNALASKAQNGSQAAKAGLIEMLSPLINKQAFMLSKYAPSMTDDLKQEGAIAVLHALRTFKAGEGVGFFPHAQTWIVRSMKAFSRCNSRVVHLPQGKDMLKCVRNVHKYMVDHRTLTNTEMVKMAEDLDVAESTVRVAVGYVLSHDVSTFAPISAHADNENGTLMLGDLLEEEQTPELLLEQMQHHIHIKSKVSAMLESLNERERYVVSHRGYLSDDDYKGKGLKELGEELGVSAERTRQIEARALSKMKEALQGIAA